jgi:hypothetical protein
MQSEESGREGTVYTARKTRRALDDETIQTFKQENILDLSRMVLITLLGSYSQVLFRILLY